MRKRILILASTLLVLPVLTMGTVMAHAESNSDSSTSSDDSNSHDSTDQSHKSRDDRFKEREDKLKLHLGEFEKNHIKNRCVFAQGRITAIDTRIKGVKTTRSKVYSHIQSILTNISTKLQAKGLDTTTLDGQITILKAKVDTFNTNMANYQQAIEDLSAMDCKADPVAFKASLETARSLRATLFTSGQEIRTYLKQTIKPTLVSLRAQLEADNSDSEGTN